MRGTIVEPSAKRLIGSLRNLGYELPQAVADIVDNSIAAKSTKVRIDIHYSGDDPGCAFQTMATECPKNS